MEDHPPRRARLLEFGLSAALIGLASLFLLDSLADLQEEAERIVVESTIRNMNSGLFLRQAELVTSGRESELPALALGNPVEWLETPPAGYQETPGCDAAGPVEAGHWCWDVLTRRLHYRPRRADGLKVDGGLPILTWRVQAPGGGGEARPGSLRIVVERNYVWQTKGLGG